MQLKCAWQTASFILRPDVSSRFFQLRRKKPRERKRDPCVNFDNKFVPPCRTQFSTVNAGKGFSNFNGDDIFSFGTGHRSADELSSRECFLDLRTRSTRDLHLYGKILNL